MASTYPGLNLREHFKYLPPPAECLAILIGTAELVVFGLGGLTDAKAFANGYGVKLDSPPEGQEPDENQKTHEGLVKAVAARNVQNGALILTFALFTRDRRSLGFAVAYGLITTAADTWIVSKYGLQNMVGGHAIGMMNSLLIGGSLLYWGRNDPWW